MFPLVERDIRKALDGRSFNEWTVEQLFHRLCSGEQQLWLVGENGARLVMLAVTRIISYPNIKRLAVDLIVGENLEGCSELIDVAGNWAEQFGCTEVEASCRPGVRKVMEKHGFSKAYEVIVKKISRSVH